MTLCQLDCTKHAETENFRAADKSHCESKVIKVLHGCKQSIRKPWKRGSVLIVSMHS